MPPLFSLEEPQIAMSPKTEGLHYTLLKLLPGSGTSFVTKKQETKITRNQTREKKLKKCLSFTLVLFTRHFSITMMQFINCSIQKNIYWRTLNASFDPCMLIWQLKECDMLGGPHHLVKSLSVLSYVAPQGEPLISPIPFTLHNITLRIFYDLVPLGTAHAVHAEGKVSLSTISRSLMTLNRCLEWCSSHHVLQEVEHFCIVFWIRYSWVWCKDDSFIHYCLITWCCCTIGILCCVFLVF